MALRQRKMIIIERSDYMNEDELVINKEMDDELSNGKGNEEV